VTPGFIQPLTTALLIEKLKYTIAKVRPDQRIWRGVVDALPGHWLDSADQLVLRCCLAHWPGSRRPGGGVTPAAGNGSPEISTAVGVLDRKPRTDLKV